MAISYFYLFVWPYKDGYQLYFPFFQDDSLSANHELIKDEEA
jgi:hypothetical protein